ncbi:hypothetical protein RhiirA4_459765 [Rhizophagus irregularis]|uniref:Uncharacterized protein n=1 Tax=Rhizophagus irregularis TaxID=588596 RepID=A0A2I1GF36_9GLOM|nr:hypothetical protein RhiirA4_459765 [Rhizophagus irregularis]
MPIIDSTGNSILNLIKHISSAQTLCDHFEFSISLNFNFPPEDVLGGLDAAITQMDWQNKTQVLLRIPPHGRNYDNYPDGDLYGLTAESVSEKLQSKDILYFFGKITDYTEKMLQIFHSIIVLFGSKSRNIYSNVPVWDILPLQKRVIMWYGIPGTPDDLKNPKYFNNDPIKEMVIKEYLKVGERNNPLEKYLEAVEVSTVAYFLSTKFNWIAEQKNITIKVNFLDDLT